MGGWLYEVEKFKNGIRNFGLKVDKGYIGYKVVKMMKWFKNIE